MGAHSKTKFKAEHDLQIYYDGIVSTGTFSLSTASIPYLPGTTNLLTFYPTPTTSSVRQYHFSTDTLVIAPISIDALIEVYVRE